MCKRQHQAAAAASSTCKRQQQAEAKMCKKRQQATSEKSKRQRHVTRTIGEEQYQEATGSGEASIKYQTDLATSNINRKQMQPKTDPKTNMTIMTNDEQPFQQPQRQERMTPGSRKQKPSVLSSSSGGEQIRYATKLIIIDYEEKGMRHSKNLTTSKNKKKPLQQKQMQAKSAPDNSKKEVNAAERSTRQIQIQQVTIFFEAIKSKKIETRHATNVAANPAIGESNKGPLQKRQQRRAKSATDNGKKTNAANNKNEETQIQQAVNFEIGKNEKSKMQRQVNSAVSQRKQENNSRSNSGKRRASVTTPSSSSGT